MRKPRTVNARLGVHGDLVWVNDLLVPPTPKPRNPRKHKA